MKLSKPEIVAIIDFMEKEEFEPKNTTNMYSLHTRSYRLGGLEVDRSSYGMDKPDYSLSLFGNDVETSEKNKKMVWDLLSPQNVATDEKIERLKEEFLRKGLSLITEGEK